MTTPNSVNKARIIAIIKGDADLRTQYSDDGGHHCVLGGLAAATGIPMPSTALVGERIGHPDLRGFVQALMDEYGLSRANLMELQKLNDGENDTPTRRERLVRYIKAL